MGHASPPHYNRDTFCTASRQAQGCQINPRGASNTSSVPASLKRGAEKKSWLSSWCWNFSHSLKTTLHFLWVLSLALFVLIKSSALGTKEFVSFDHSSFLALNFLMKSTTLDIKRHIQKYLTITFSPISTFAKVEKGSVRGKKGMVSFLVKVHIFWEGNKILRNLHRRFVLCSASQIYSGDFAKFCGLLRIYELYLCERSFFLISGACIRKY